MPEWLGLAPLGAGEWWLIGEGFVHYLLCKGENAVVFSGSLAVIALVWASWLSMHPDRRP